MQNLIGPFDTSQPAQSIHEIKTPAPIRTESLQNLKLKPNSSSNEKPSAFISTTANSKKVPKPTPKIYKSSTKTASADRRVTQEVKDKIAKIMID